MGPNQHLISVMFGVSFGQSAVPFLFAHLSTSMLNICLTQLTFQQQMSTGKNGYLDNHYGKIQIQDHEMSTNPVPQNNNIQWSLNTPFTKETFLDLFGSPIFCKNDYSTHTWKTLATYGHKYCCPIFSNLVAHISFFNVLDKSIDQHNLAIFSPIFGIYSSKNFCYLVPKEYFQEHLSQYPLISYIKIIVAGIM